MQRDAHLMCLYDIQSVLQHYNYSNGFAANLGSSGASQRTPSPSGSSREAALLRERGSGPETPLENRLEMIRFYQRIFEGCMRELRNFAKVGTMEERKDAWDKILDKMRKCYDLLEGEIDALLATPDNPAKEDAIEALEKILPTWTLKKRVVPGWTKAGWENREVVAGRWNDYFDFLFGSVFNHFHQSAPRFQ